MMNVPQQCDVVVIGGGPAGSVVATLLSRQGYDVVLLEKAKHPRYNVGESLIPHFWKYCDLIGVADQIQAEGFIAKAGGTVCWNGIIRQVAFKDFGYRRPALHVERDRFDYLLLQNAKAHGVQVYEEMAVLHADFDHGDRVRVRYRPVRDHQTQGTGEKTAAEIACRVVVDASGQGAVLARQMGARIIDDAFRFMSLWGYFTGSKYVAADGRAYPVEHLTSRPPTTFVANVGAWGWAWHIPLRQSTSVGLVLPLEQMKHIKAGEEALETFFLRQCQQIPFLNRLLEGAQYCPGSLHVIRDYSYRPAQLAGPGFFLVGDAAAFVDPIFSVGVTLAMYSACSAAWAVDRCFKQPDRQVNYQAIYANHFLDRLEVARSLALPRYGVGPHASARATSAIKFETTLELELMYVVSTLTSRNENFQELVRNSDGQHITSTKYRVLETIEF